MVLRTIVLATVTFLAFALSQLAAADRRFDVDN